MSTDTYEIESNYTLETFEIFENDTSTDTSTEHLIDSPLDGWLFFIIPALLIMLWAICSKHDDKRHQQQVNRAEARIALRNTNYHSNV